MGTLYLVSTPIGNLEDISQRAARILSQVQLIAAEDTRHTRKLLRHLEIDTRMISYHEHNKIEKINEILTALSTGDVALVSDAGTPSINDPGYELVQAAHNSGYPVSPIPGPSAPLTALVASGLPTDAFLYLGYLPRKAGARRQLLEQISTLPYTLILLETPHRLTIALKDLMDLLGDRQVCVAREMTKFHEEFFRGSLTQAIQHFSEQEPRGEFTLVIQGSLLEPEQWSEEKLRNAMLDHLKQGEPISRIATELASQSGWSRRKIYQQLIEIQSQNAEG